LKKIYETDYQHKTSAVHLSSIMKTKSNAQYLAKILHDDGTLQETKLNLIKSWARAGLEFRTLISFKNQLYDSESLDNRN